MGLPAYLATNRITAASTLTLSSEDAVHTKANLYDRIAGNVCKSASKTSWTIDIDLGSALAADTLMIVNHNFTASAVLSLKADNSTPPTTTIATPLYRVNDLWVDFTSTAVRYWRLTVTDSNSAYLQMGQLVPGTRVTLPIAHRIGHGHKPAQRRGMISHETFRGVPHNYERFTRKTRNYTFRTKSAAELAVFTTLDTTVRGSLYPFAYIPDVSGAEVLYVRKQVDFEPEEHTKRVSGGELVHDLTLELTAESRGRELTR